MDIITGSRYNEAHLASQFEEGNRYYRPGSLQTLCEPRLSIQKIFSTHHSRGEIDELYSSLHSREARYDDHENGNKVKDDKHNHPRGERSKLRGTDVITLKDGERNHRVRCKPPAEPLSAPASFSFIR